ncbi:MAG: arylamine N-acetyltransferase [Mycobacterium sp.]
MTHPALTVEPLRGLDPDEIAGYLSRIGYAGPTDPTLETLHAVVSAHLRTIAFENLDPLMGVPVFDLGAAALFQKMVRRHRGGYCFEHNGLMGYVLAGLGFDTQALTARVVWMNPDGLQGPPPPLTHQLLAVRIPGDEQRYLVDVGFGGQTLTSPIRFVAGQVQQTRHEPYRVQEVGAGFALETLIGDNWRPLYLFTDEPRPLIDLQLGSWYVSTHPTSKFVTGLAASIITDDARVNLNGRHLTVHHRDGHSERFRLANASAVLEVLMNRFGIDVGGLGDVHLRITEVLDA